MMMTITPSPTESPLLIYRALADQLRSAFADPDRAAAIRRSVSDQPVLTIEQVERLRQEADRSIWYAPRRGWALAAIGCTLAAGLDRADVRAQCDLTFAIALTALGEFAQALPLLQDLAQRFSALNQLKGFARSQIELVLVHTQRGEFGQTQVALDHAHETIGQIADPVLAAYCDRAEGIALYEQNRHREAVPVLERAASAFVKLGLPGEAAITWCHLVPAQAPFAAQTVLDYVQRARQISAPALTDSIHAARCDLYTAFAYELCNRYAESLALYQRVRSAFADQGMLFMVSLCDLYEGVERYRFDQFELAQQCYLRARESFLAQDLPTFSVQCDMNLALVYQMLNRYAQAVPLHLRAAERAAAEGRQVRAARSYMNLGECYDRLGQYERAIDVYLRAIEDCLAANNPMQAALARKSLARTYQHVGRYPAALDQVLRARSIFEERQLPIDLAACDMYLAEIYEALDRRSEAIACLDTARGAYAQLAAPVQLAQCERSLAHMLLNTQRAPEAIDLLLQAQTIFNEQALPIDSALCDLLSGDAALNQNQINLARKNFARALTVFDPGFPEYAWRACYGLGQCALAEAHDAQALTEWSAAIQLINQTRVTLSPEQLSGAFFADRQRLYQAAIQLALKLGDADRALILVEASKAQTYVNWRSDQFWQAAGPNDDRLKRLIDRESRLRADLDRVRSQLRADRSTRPDVLDRAAAFERLKQLSIEYEEVIEQLRMAAPARTQVQLPQAFSLDDLRRVLARRWDDQWACLEYYLEADELIIFYITQQQLKLARQRLSKFDRVALEQCTRTAQDYRRMLYGSTAPNSASHDSLRQLYELLLPADLPAIDPEWQLFIVPHGQLHALPFAALLNSTTPLVRTAPIVLTPSLSALQALTENDAPLGQPAHALAIGLEDFGSEADPLPYSREEINALREIFAGRVKILWGAAANRTALNQLLSATESTHFDIIHFATHAVLEPAAPSLSRILLKDDSLTVSDILNLRFNARVIVLSSCASAIGQRYAGDEIIGLAQAFFFTGARTVVASLWPIEDAAAAEIMRRFYRHLDRDPNISAALRSAQQEMIDLGYSMYHWAAFEVIGAG